ncbi:uncharacterized protein I206_107685 [Kwoniella pini CBS 10737]|uniref:NAD(P)-binding protein n=1 Tax=Kwoniella pini CBS 10737 TaxID=1296096 RepID=A0AAJ8LCW1_9TREE
MSYSSFEVTNLFSVKGKVVVVTGGGTGIGRAITTALAINGAKVYIIGRRLETLQNTADELSTAASKNDGQVIPLQGDILTKEGIHAVSEHLIKIVDKVDYLINNAGVGTNYKIQAEKGDLDALEKKLGSIETSDFTDMATNYISAPWQLSIALLPLLRKSKDPVITNISSLAALITKPDIIHPAYGSAKAGESHLTRLLAANLIPFKIRVNSLSPGIFKSQATTGSSDPNTPVVSFLDSFVKSFPAGREGTWEELAGIALLLATPAGAHVNGIDIVIDGGAKLVFA